jgi:PST family polysaccharide transporter
MSLADKAVTGFLWGYSAYVGGRLLKLLATAILARILFPQDFGLVAFALLMLGLLEAVRDFGIKDALIYTQERIDEVAETAFVINLVIGTVQCLLGLLLAPLAVHFVDDVRAVDVVRVLSVTLLINALGNTHGGLLQKKLKFRQHALPDILSTLGNGVVAVTFAFLGYGVWSLVAGHLAGSVVRTASRWRLLPWIPRFRFSTERARALFGYGVYILLFELLGVLAFYADQWMVGILLGTAQLGYYMIAMRMPELVTQNFCMVLTKVLFPTFSVIQNDRERLTRGFHTAMKYTAFVTVPAGVGLAAVAPELVPLLFGDQWHAAIVLTQVLALVGTVATLYWSAGDVFKAIGRPDLTTKLLVIEALYAFPLILLVTLQYRVAVMAALARLLAVSITAALRLWLASRFLQFPMRTLYHTLHTPLLGAGAMFGAIYLWRQLAESWPPAFVLATSIALGGLTYLIVVWFIQREYLIEARATLRRLHRRSDIVESAGGG